MLGRLFGKNQDTSGEAVCAKCGRTLLAGELTQRVEEDDGTERLLCSLCAQSSELPGGERHKVGNGSANAARVPGQDAEEAGTAARPEEPVRDENAALWKAIKDRDAQIDRLKETLARGEAERQELLGRLARLQAAAGVEAVGQAGAAAIGGEPAEVQAVAIAAEPAGDAQLAVPLTAEAAASEIAGEATEEVPLSAEPAVDTGGQALAEDTADIAAPETPEEEAGTEAAEAATETAEAADASPDAADIEEQAASMTLLQRGVDLLNVSPVPQKIAGTNADLGIPTVHVGFDGVTATATFMWSMGWYRFAVDVDSGAVSLGDRGYDERDDLQPNASVRADGTVQLAPAMISRAAANRQQAEQDAAPVEVAEEPVAEPAPEAPPEAAPAAGGPEILSKSLLGQRTDDERPSWEGTQARDFDWDR